MAFHGAGPTKGGGGPLGFKNTAAKLENRVKRSTFPVNNSSVKTVRHIVKALSGTKWV